MTSPHAAETEVGTDKLASCEESKTGWEWIATPDQGATAEVSVKEESETKEKLAIEMASPPAAETEVGTDKLASCEESKTGWRRIATLGRGATAEVSVWEESETKEKLAIKISTRQKFSQKHYTYWTREVSVMKKLKHENVVRGYDCPDEIRYQIPYRLPPLAMDYCNGGSLRQFLRSYRHGVPESELRNILHDICAGLRYLHRKHIVHRDIKPDNIVIQKAERFIYKITDLGYMKILDPRNNTHSFIGTAGYAAPEILNSNHVRRYNYLVDYWSLGITIFEVATGFRPFRDMNVCPRKGDAIWARKTISGIEYIHDLPQRCQFTLALRGVLTQWLRTMLQYYPARRNPDVNQTPLASMLQYIRVTDKPEINLRPRGGDERGDGEEAHQKTSKTI